MSGGAGDVESAPTYCKGSGRTPTEKTRIGGTPWGRCRGCRQWRPLFFYRDEVKGHVRIAGLVTPDAS